MLSHASRSVQPASIKRSAKSLSTLSSLILDSGCFGMLRSQPPQQHFSPGHIFMNDPCHKVKSSRGRVTSAVAIVLTMLMGFTQTFAQTEDTFSDDPVKLFERGQNAHSRGDLLKALELYDEAIKVRPEFPEAEFQRGSVLVGLDRLPDAESSFRRAIELRKDWSLPHAALGALLLRLDRNAEAEPALRQALKLDGNNNLALRMLAEFRLRTGNSREALELLQRATRDTQAPMASWLLLARAQRSNGDNSAALTSLDRVLENEPGNAAALIERAEVLLSTVAKERAIQDLLAAEPLVKGDRALASRIAAAYELAGKPDEALRIARQDGLITTKGASDGPNKVLGTPEEIGAANSDDPEKSRPALENLLKKNPNSAMLLARLGDAYRKTDASRSLDYYRRALEIEPSNAEHATGYSSALVQSRRFADAVAVLRKVLAATPNNYAAHANLATALYSLKQYPEALAEYQWLLKSKPDVTIAHYFIATAHDNLGEYEQALTAYEFFIAHADPTTNQLEIEKVKLRLPLLRRQIQLGEGKKRKTSQKRDN